MKFKVKEHIGTIFTFALILGFIGVIYLPPMLRSGFENLPLYQAECYSGIQTNMGIEKKCRLFENEFNKHINTLKSEQRGNGAFVLAKFNFVQGNLELTKKYCTDAIVHLEKTLKETEAQLIFQTLTESKKLAIDSCKETLLKLK